VQVFPVERCAKQLKLLQSREGSRDQLGRCTGAKGSLHTGSEERVVSKACQPPVIMSAPAFSLPYMQPYCGHRGPPRLLDTGFQEVCQQPAALLLHLAENKTQCEAPY
jgi:hypothetical protein